MPSPCDALRSPRLRGICDGSIPHARRADYVRKLIRAGELPPDALAVLDLPPRAEVPEDRGRDSVRRPAPARPKVPPPVGGSRILTPEDLPCVHRGEKLGEVACVPCRSAGFSGAAVYACGVHRLCMIHNWSARDPRDNATACVTCGDRTEPGEVSGSPSD